MKAVGSSSTLVPFYWNTWHHNLDSAEIQPFSDTLQSVDPVNGKAHINIYAFGSNIQESTLLLLSFNYIHDITHVVLATKLCEMLWCWSAACNVLYTMKQYGEGCFYA